MAPTAAAGSGSLSTEASLGIGSVRIARRRHADPGWGPALGLDTGIPVLCKREDVQQAWHVFPVDEIVPAIKRAAANGKPSIINVEVDHVSPSPFIGGYSAMTKTDK